MPILAVDANGQIYATSPDRADGLGYGHYPECQSQGDLTLGSAYLKSQARQREALIRRKRQQAMLDTQEQMRAYEQNMRLEKKRRAERAEIALLENPIIQDNLMRKALAGGCECSYSTAMSGNVMTANGQSGWRGMSRDQQTIHNAVTGMGNNTAFRVDPMEARQAQMRADAERILRLKARR